MKCRYCNIALAPLRSLADGEYCCDDHRTAHLNQPAAVPEASQAPESAATTQTPEDKVEPVPAVEPEVPAASQMLRLRFAAPPPVSGSDALRRPVLPVVAPAPVAFSGPKFPQPQEPVLQQIIELPAEKFEPVSEPHVDGPIAAECIAVESNAVEAEESRAEEYYEDVEPDGVPDVDAAESPSLHPARDIAASWTWIRTAWNSAPRDLKLVTIVLPILAALAVTGSFPRVPIETVAPANVAQVQKAVNDHWKVFAQTISDRAAIAYSDDFRSGLDAWESRSHKSTSWSYDAAGFVRPGPLAIFKPTIELADYHFEFLGEIDQKALGWVFRAQDMNNYYAMKFVVVKPGPLPLVDMVRYAVINGKEGPRVVKPLPITVRPDMLYRVLVDVRGADFTVIAQGQVVDFWTDRRLPHGGVGFFSSRGERSRLRWVEVSHQYDALGRVCAYLAPYGFEGRNGSFN